ncbi:MAG: Fic family protein [Campylobacteraceae bacterium]|jgi:Fic family protein|nr:Fic family protein [Campylobacteraceae bacterium]
MIAKNKYNMSVEQNIFWAKRNIVDYICKSAKLEGLNVTYPETYAIYEEARLKDLDVRTVNVIINLKHAWQELFFNINEELNIDCIKKIHREVARGEALVWGSFRTGKVGISGTDYKPPIPEEKSVKNELEQLLRIENHTERAISVMLWGMRSQLFWDGNKRTSMLIANKIMIENGCGIISILPEDLKEFGSLLSEYYTTNQDKKIKQFIYEKCIDGLDFPKDTETENKPKIKGQR